MISAALKVPKSPIQKANTKKIENVMCLSIFMTLKE